MRCDRSSIWRSSSRITEGLARICDADDGWEVNTVVEGDFVARTGFDEWLVDTVLAAGPANKDVDGEDAAVVAAFKAEDDDDDDGGKFEKDEKEEEAEDEETPIGGGDNILFVTDRDEVAGEERWGIAW